VEERDLPGDYKKVIRSSVFLDLTSPLEVDILLPDLEGNG
jgi:hypothetical protein